MGRGEWKIRVGRGEWDEGSGKKKRGKVGRLLNLFCCFIYQINKNMFLKIELFASFHDFLCIVNFR